MLADLLHLKKQFDPQLGIQKQPLELRPQPELGLQTLLKPPEVLISLHTIGY